MSDDKRDEWEPWVKERYSSGPDDLFFVRRADWTRVADFLKDADADRIVADHAAARDLAQAQDLMRTVAEGCLRASLHSNPMLAMRAYSEATWPLVALLSPATENQE